jgi:hypothetical protein
MDNRGHVWQPGDLLAGRYQVSECLRRAGTCCLYRVRDTSRNMPQLALGPAPGCAATPEGLAWFETYCTSVLSIKPHPNVLAARRMDRHQGVAFLVMRNASGLFWDGAISGERLTDLARMLDVAGQVARGIAALHSQDRMHYNVKPANVLLTDEGVAKLWRYGEAGAKTRVYASPEQLAGAAELTPASDVWSWAVSVLHMFVGKATWKSGTKGPVILARYMRNGPAKRNLPLMPGRAAQILADCFLSDPGTRPSDLAEVADEFEAMREALAEGTAEFPPPVEPVRAGRNPAPQAGEAAEPQVAGGDAELWDEADVLEPEPDWIVEDGQGEATILAGDPGAGLAVQGPAEAARSGGSSEPGTDLAPREAETGAAAPAGEPVGVPPAAEPRAGGEAVVLGAGTRAPQTDASGTGAAAGQGRAELTARPQEEPDLRPESMGAEEREPPARTPAGRTVGTDRRAPRRRAGGRRWRFHQR